MTKKLLSKDTMDELLKPPSVSSHPEESAEPTVAVQESVCESNVIGATSNIASSAINRRGGLALVLGALAGIGALLDSRTALAAQPKLVVFLHVDMNQRAFQKQLSEALPGVDVSALGRVADFERASEDADVLLSLPAVIQDRGAPTLRGVRSGSPSEFYSLLGPERPPNPRSVVKVGALDVLGRKRTTDFVRRIVRADPQVVQVTKLDDLVPLLQLSMADAILAPTRLVAALKARSRTTLGTTDLTEPVGLPAVLQLRPAGASVVEQIKRLPMALNQTIGVDGWR